MSLSPFEPASLVSRVNASAVPQAVDTLLAHVFRAAQDVNRASGGAFDPTVAPLVNLWGFGYKGGHEQAAPTDAAVDSALAGVGIGECRIASDTLYKKTPSTEFNFSAITKGFGCDEVAAMLRRNGVGNYMVEIGGEIAVGGHNREGKPWHIMIDAPVASDTEVVHRSMGIVELGDCGLATSGNYRNFREVDGRRVGHTISPSTGRPVESVVLSASVIAPSAMLADAFATALMAMDPDEGIAMIEATDSVEAMIIVGGTAESGYSTVATQGFIMR